MSQTACALLRHDIRPRFIGDLVAAYCHTCRPGHLLIPDPAPAAGASGETSSPRGLVGHARRSSAPAVPATVSPLPGAASKASPAH